MKKVGWPTCKLDELGFVGRGKSKHRPRNEPSLYGGPYPFFQTGDIKAADFYLTNYTQTYNEKGLAQSKLWEPGTLCITIAANIAETAILGVRGCFPDSVVGFTPDREKCDVRFIKYFTDTIKLRMQNVSRGTTQNNLSLEKLLTFVFPAPPLPEQQKIAGILAAYDDLIENNTRRIQILEQMAQSIYWEWFVHFRFPGHEKDMLVESPLGKIPQGWDVVRISERFKTVLGGTPSRKKPEFWTDGTVPWINSGKINELRIIDASELITRDAFSKSATKLMPRRTTVLAITGATLGQVSLLEIEACANQSVVGIVDSSGIYSEYLYLKTKEVIGELVNHASGGAQQHINKEVVNEFKIVLPPEPLVIRFNKFCKPFFDLLVNKLRQNANLRSTRDLLLPKLISGELSVDNVEANP